jgi:hypothetical protein
MVWHPSGSTGQRARRASPGIAISASRVAVGHESDSELHRGSIGVHWGQWRSAYCTRGHFRYMKTCSIVERCTRASIPYRTSSTFQASEASKIVGCTYSGFAFQYLSQLSVKALHCEWGSTFCTSVFRCISQGRLRRNEPGTGVFCTLFQYCLAVESFGHGWLQCTPVLVSNVQVGFSSQGLHRGLRATAATILGDRFLHPS